MKKIIFIFCFTVAACFVHAQTKITKTAVIGKWVLASVETPNAFFYDADKDSLVIGAILKAQIPAEQMGMVVPMMKQKIGEAFKKASFTFNADGTAELNSGTGEVKKASYTVDEANSTITTTENDEKKTKEEIKVMMIKDRLQFVLPNMPQGAVTLML